MGKVLWEAFDWRESQLSPPKLPIAYEYLTSAVKFSVPFSCVLEFICTRIVPVLLLYYSLQQSSSTWPSILLHKGSYGQLHTKSEASGNPYHSVDSVKSWSRDPELQWHRASRAFSNSFCPPLPYTQFGQDYQSFSCAQHNEVARISNQLFLCPAMEL